MRCIAMPCAALQGIPIPCHAMSCDALCALRGADSFSCAVFLRVVHWCRTYTLELVSVV
jgi:hypothetical protein